MTAAANARPILKRDALAAWKRFVSCIKALPPDEAGSLWESVWAEATAAR
jgi:hypothetical protein